MPETTDAAEKSRVMRDLARRARRLAQSLSHADQERLLKHADELEQQASELELQAIARPPVVQVQMQLQQQQQQENRPPAAEPEGDKPKG